MLKSWSLICSALLAAGCDGDSAVGPAGSDNAPSSPRSFVSMNPIAYPMEPGSNRLPPVGSSVGGGVERTVQGGTRTAAAGDRFYVLSQEGTLSLFNGLQTGDVSLGGKYQLGGRAMDLQVRGDSVLVLSHSRSQGQDLSGASHLVALSQREPGSVVELGRVELDGAALYSTISGNIYYAVLSTGAGWSFECAGGGTRVVSVDISDLATMSKVDELDIDDGVLNPGTRFATRSEERIYLTSIAKPSQMATEVQVLDIADPEGNLAANPVLTVPGKLTHSSQLDEADGVLRVVARPPERAETEALFEHTFSLEDATSPIASIELSVQGSSELGNVLFNESWAHALVDSGHRLVTLDFSDPAAPSLSGTLELPQPVQHLTLVGTQILGVGGQDQSGYLSLIDAGEPATLYLVDQIPLAGTFQWLSSDESRLEKPLTVADGRVFVPVGRSGTEHCNEAGENGVQIVRLAPEGLQAESIATMPGPGRAAFIAGQNLVALSDHRLATFDVSDPTTPVLRKTLATTEYVSRTLQVGDDLIRVGQAPFYGITQLSSAPLGSPESPTWAFEIPPPSEGCRERRRLVSAFGGEDGSLRLLFDVYRDDPTEHETRVVTVGIDGDEIQVSADEPLGFLHQFEQVGNLPFSGTSRASTSSVLALAQRALDAGGSGYQAEPSELRVFSVPESGVPEDTATIALPFDLGATGLLLSGSILATSHWEAADDDGNRARFFLDRFDLSDDQAPMALHSIQIPGSLLAFDQAASRAFVLDYTEIVEENVSRRECHERFAWRSFSAEDRGDGSDEALGTCSALTESIHLVEFDEQGASVAQTLHLAPNELIEKIAAGEDRLFALLAGENPLGGIDDGNCLRDRETVDVLVVSGISSGVFETGRVAFERTWDGIGGQAHLAAGGTHAAYLDKDGRLTVFEASNPRAPLITQETFGPGTIADDLEIADDAVMASFGSTGALIVPLQN